MLKMSRFSRGVAFFFGSLAGLAAVVFLYIFLSGGGELGRSYLSAYYPLAVLVLLLAAAATRSSRRKGV
jgi:hypothetical protein